MNLLTYIFIIFSNVNILLLPRKWAVLPFLMAACYITVGQVENIGPFHFNVIRMLVPFGLIRIFMRSERPTGGLNSMDWFIIAWAIWALFSSVFHKDLQTNLINRLGRSYDVLGIYFLIRCFCQNEEEAKEIIKITAVILIPVALEMLNEQLTYHNFFSIFGGVSETPAIRESHIRSQGPFRHSILAGTIGATTFPLMIGIWRINPILAKIGAVVCITMVLTSFSSGPWMSFICSVIALVFWRWRHHTKELKIAIVVSYILLELVMKAPAYYIIARIDLSGGSTGWHRAKLIESAFQHFNEWWLAGTDFTRHWMPTGVSWSPDHTDITNHYLMMGVLGGLPLMLIFILTLWLGFRYIGQSIKSQYFKQRVSSSFFFWCLGSSLFAHTVTLIGVSYFDQSFLFLYLTLAIISSIKQSIKKKPTVEI